MKLSQNGGFIEKKIKISVKTLVMFVNRSGDLDSSFKGTNRQVEGIRVHIKIQKSRPVEYSGEVSVYHLEEINDITLEINGRIDGVYQYKDRIIIDEIKTTYRDLEKIDQEGNPIHWDQVKVYSYIYLILHQLEKIETQLTYYNLQTDKTIEIRKEFTKNELESFFKKMVDSYIKWIKTISKLNNDRDKSITTLNFPFSSYRKGLAEHGRESIFNH